MAGGTLLSANQVLQNVYDEVLNKLRVDIGATIIAGALEVSLDAAVDSIKIGNGGQGPYLKINPDGTINVVINDIPSSGSIIVSKYNEILALASNATIIIVSYTVPPFKQAVLQRVHFSGENIGRYDLKVNGTTQDTSHTMFGGDLTGYFEFTTGNSSGLVLNAGDLVTVQVNNPRPYTGTYESRIQILEITP